MNLTVADGGVHFKITGKLSEQNLVDYSEAVGNMRCRGG